MGITTKTAAKRTGLHERTIRRIATDKSIGQLITARLLLFAETDLPKLREAAAKRKRGRPIVGQSSQNGTPKKRSKNDRRRKSLPRKGRKNRQNA